MEKYLSRQTFTKEERLKSRKAIELLFEKGHKEKNNPLLVYWLINELPVSYPAQVAISVPKKLFKSAVKRNLIKRRIRESYRKNKASFYNKFYLSKKQVLIFFIYQSKYIADYNTIENSVISLLKKIENNVI